MGAPEIDPDPTIVNVTQRAVEHSPMSDIIVTLRKQETCQVIIRNVPYDHTRRTSEWLELALSARGKDWEEDDIEVDSVQRVPSGSDGMAEVEFKELKAV